MAFLLECGGMPRHVHDMDNIIPVIVGVFAGNSLFAWFLWGLRKLDVPDTQDVDWSAYQAVIVPLLIFGVLLWFTVGPPPHLGQ